MHLSFHNITRAQQVLQLSRWRTCGQSIIKLESAYFITGSLSMRIFNKNFWRWSCYWFRAVANSKLLWTNCMEMRPSWAADSRSTVQKIPYFYGTLRFITMFARIHHWILSWAIRIQFTTSLPISLRATIILSCHLRMVSRVVSYFQHISD
jgi:hypothetical protein